MQVAEPRRVSFDHLPGNDLVLHFEDCSFHCHRGVLLPASRFLEKYVGWPFIPKRRSLPLNEFRMSAVLPKIVIVDHRVLNADRSASEWFEVYLRLVYRLDSPPAGNVNAICALIQIADCILSESVVSLCDQLLSETKLTEEGALVVALFCQQYALPKTWDVLKREIAANLVHYKDCPRLYQVDPKHFRDIVKLSDHSRTWTFWIVVAYAAGVVPKNDQFEEDVLRIKEPQQAALFLDLVSDISRSWSRETVNLIYACTQIYSIALEAEGSDQSFLYRTIAACYHRLDQQSGLF